MQRVENNQEDVNPHEEEINKLYKWILWRLENSVESCKPALPKHHVKLTTEEVDGKIILKHGMEEYRPEYIEGECFYDIICEVAAIFNMMKKYRANYCSPEPKNKTFGIRESTLDVFLEI